MSLSRSQSQSEFKGHGCSPLALCVILIFLASVLGTESYNLFFSISGNPSKIQWYGICLTVIHCVWEWMCEGGWTCTHHSAHVEVKRKSLGVSSILLSHGYLELSSGYQVWRQVLLPTEPGTPYLSHWIQSSGMRPMNYFLKPPPRFCCPRFSILGLFSPPFLPPPSFPSLHPPLPPSVLLSFLKNLTTTNSSSERQKMFHTKAQPMYN